MSEEITTVDAQLEKIVLAMENIVSILEADSGSKKSVTLTKSVDEPIDEVKDEPIEELKKSVGDDDAEH